MDLIEIYYRIARYNLVIYISYKQVYFIKILYDIYITYLFLNNEIIYFLISNPEYCSFATFLAIILNNQQIFNSMFIFLNFFMLHIMHFIINYFIMLINSKFKKMNFHYFEFLSNFDFFPVIYF
jgi:hypothetical protein